MQEVAEILAEDMREKTDKDILNDAELMREMKEIISDELKEKIEDLSEDEVREKALEALHKCEGIEFTPYIDKTVQKQFYCKFDGLVTVLEKQEKKNGVNSFYYTKWYKKGGASYYIGWLTVGMIKKMMRRSIKEKCDIIMEMIKSFKKGDKTC